MPELDAILETWRGLSGPAANAVLATVVHVTGSAYRRPGARMLLVPDGRRVGCVSGGCLEGDVSRKAWWWTQSGEPALRVYDTTTDEDTTAGTERHAQVCSDSAEQLAKLVEGRGAAAVAAERGGSDFLGGIGTWIFTVHRRQRPMQ